jgi:formate dehydrogenase major subunit
MKCGCADVHECKLRKFGTDYEADPETFPKGEYSRPQRTVEANKYYLRNMDKCISCGVCVRACSQQAIYSAIDFQHRG